VLVRKLKEKESPFAQSFLRTVLHKRQGHKTTANLMSDKVRRAQPSISQFFKKTKKSEASEQPPPPVIIVADDQDTKRDAKQAPDERVKEYAFDENYTPHERDEQSIKIHKQFKKKLDQGVFMSAKDQVVGSDEEDETDEPVPPPTKKQKIIKLTPLEQQVKELKLKHMDKVLAIQVGYKYKFYCQDAVKVHKILNIMLVPGKLNLINETPVDQMYNKLAYCSIPEPRLHIHLQRLLDAGLKVGVVDQVETSIVKAMESSNKSALFTRKMSNVFTRATYIEFDEKNRGIKDDRAVDSLMAILETKGKEDGTVIVTIVSIQPLTGEIIYDIFEDEFLRNELNTRLLHLEPIEILYFEDSLSRLTAQTIEAFMRQHSTQIRISTFPELKRTYFETFLNSYVSEYPALFDFVASKSLSFQTCCSLLIEYLKEFQLDASFQVKENYVAFAEVAHMILNANTLQNLEIFQNSTTGEEFGSLLWLVNHTRTKFGFRLLRKWIGQPLVQREHIEHRLNAVENIQNSFNHFLESLAESLKSCPDLEKILNRIHYNKVKRKEMYIFLSKLNDVDNLVTKFGRFDILANLQAPLLKESFRTLIQLCLDTNISQYFKMINSQYAMDDKSSDHILKYFNLNNFTINHDEILTEDAEITQIKQELGYELKENRELLKRPTLEYVEKSREPYLIEVRNSQVKDLPKDWIKLSSTKLVSRFRPPKVAELYKKLLYHNELYLSACDVVFQKFIKEINTHYPKLSTMIRSLAQYDCLLSLAATSSASGFTRPTFVDEKVVSIENGRNPIIEQLSNFVPNSTSLSSKTQCMIITGPNMGGKSSYVKQVALIVIMAQIGCYIPAEYATLGVFTTVLTRMGAQDDLLKGESTFFTEMSQVLGILNEMSRGGNKLIILDEIGRGTGTVDGISLADSILEYILEEHSNSLTLFITHFPSICKLSKKYESVENYHMGYIEERSSEGDWPKVTFLYTLVSGMADNSYGLNVAKLAGVDDRIIQDAFEVSEERKRQVESSTVFHETIQLSNGLKKLLQCDSSLKDTIKLIELIDTL
jgi:DNA mismatch repair protein MSH3